MRRRRRCLRRGFLARNLRHQYRVHIVTHTGGRLRSRRRVALMESLEESARATHQAALPAVVRPLRGPTVINNVETIPPSARDRDGRPAYAPWARRATGGTRLFGITATSSGPRLRTAHGIQPEEDDLRSRRASEAPRTQAVVPAGSPLLFCYPKRSTSAWTSTRWRRPVPCLARAAGLIDDQTCMVEFALRPSVFISTRAGWCIPCREGTDWLKKSLTRFTQLRHRQDIDNIRTLRRT